MIYGIIAGLALIVVGLLKDNFSLYIPIAIVLIVAIIIRYRNQIQNAVPQMNWGWITAAPTWIGNNKTWLLPTAMVLFLTTMYASIFDLGMNPRFTFILVVAIVSAVLVVMFFAIKGNIAKRVLYWSSVIVIALCSASIITGAFDPRDLLPDAEKNWMLYSIKKNLEKRDQNTEKKRLNEILENIENGAEPSYADMKFMEEVEGRKNADSLLARISNASFSFRSSKSKKVESSWEMVGGVRSYTPKWDKQNGIQEEYLIRTLSPGTYKIVATGCAKTRWKNGTVGCIKPSGISHFSSVLAKCYFANKNYGELIVRVGDDFHFLNKEITIGKSSDIKVFSNKLKHDPKDYTMSESNIQIKILKEKGGLNKKERCA